MAPMELMILPVTKPGLYIPTKCNSIVVSDCRDENPNSPMATRTMLMGMAMMHHDAVAMAQGNENVDEFKRDLSVTESCCGWEPSIWWSNDGRVRDDFFVQWAQVDYNDRTGSHD